MKSTIKDVQNPNCPGEALTEVLRRGKDDAVSWYAASNPNCPGEAKLEWENLKIAEKEYQEMFEEL